MPTQTPPHYVPPGLAPIIPHLVIAGAQAALTFYIGAFGAEVVQQMPGPRGTIMHASIKIGDGTLFVSDATAFAKPTASNLYLYVRDVDAVYGRAIAAGATVLAPLSNMFWGDRWGMVADPFGNRWQLGCRVEAVEPDELARRISALKITPVS